MNDLGNRKIELFMNIGSMKQFALLCLSITINLFRGFYYYCIKFIPKGLSNRLVVKFGLPVRFSIFIMALLSPVISLAQMTAPGSSAVRYTAYSSAPGVRDPLFIFCNPTESSVMGTLNAVRPGGSVLYDFNWYGWSDLTKSFSTPLKTETGVTVSSLTGLNEGGYKVDISEGGIYDTSLVGWIFFDKPPKAFARLQQELCERVALKGTAAATVNAFYYRDIADGSSVTLNNEVTFLWSSTPSSVIPFPDLDTIPLIYFPPLDDVTYKLNVNSLGCSSESSFFYPSIHVKADFTADPTQGEAPLEVTFTDKSIRGSKKYTWEFGEKTPDGKKAPDWIINEDSLWVLGSPFTHTYYIPGEYSVKLTIEGEHCIDSFRLDPKIVVDPSNLTIPNVFTPDGDGLNDFFLVEARSLRFLSVEVFSRSGIKVYTFTGDGEKLKEWQGWDGNFNNTSINTSPGVYFYIIKALGWDGVLYNSKEYRGFVYLYR